MSELKVMREIMLEAPRLQCRLFRNNVGVMEDARGNKVKFGLTLGSADLIGWSTRLSTVARFMAIEVKAPGWKPPKSGPKFEAWQRQRAFLDAVVAAGGIAGVAQSVEDFRRIVTAP